MPRIRRLEIQGFRGIRQQVSLLLEGKSVLLFGENGTGKSSFVDALEKLFTGRVSTLDGRAQGLSSDQHGPHIRDGHYPPRIAITFDDSSSTIFDPQTSVQSLPPQLQEYIKAARENLYILRRLQILHFIESQPRERYDFLRPFLPLSGIEAMEDTLRQALERTRGEAEAETRELDRRIQELRRVLSGRTFSQAPTEHEVVAAVNQELAAVSHPPITTLHQLPEALKLLTGALARFGDLSRQSRLTSAVRSLEDFTEGISRINVTPLVISLVNLREKEAQEARVFYETVLEQGIRWIREESRVKCPLCEQAINGTAVIGRAQERLVAAREIVNLRQAARQALEAVRQAVRSAAEARRRLDVRVKDLHQDEKDGLEQAIKTAGDVIVSLETAIREEVGTINIELLRGCSSQISQGGSIIAGLNQCRERFLSYLSSLPSPQDAQKLLTVRERLERVSQIWPTISQAQASSEEALKRVGIAQALLENAQAARKEEVQSLFDGLSKEINDIYFRLHPDEGRGGVRLEIREAVQRSVNVRANFYDRSNEDPRAYYNDADLDTLGLSIFLALRRWYRKQRPGFDLLVLDDVLTSVDTANAVRISELLLQEFKDYQILLTTHDRIWFEHLRDIQARCRVANNFINKIIHKWSIDEGPDIREPEDERKEIDHLISEGSGKEIAVMAGRLLEHILQEIRYSFRLSVQAKRGEQYEIGDLWPAFYAMVKKEYPTLYNQARLVLDALDVRWPIRNWIGAHHNHWAQNVSRSTAIDFAMAVGALYDLLFCTSCRRFIGPSATPIGQLSCRCGDIIYPAPGKEAVRPKTREELIKETEGALRDARLDSELYLTWKRAEAGREH
jgi:energy-coupling factor transporter ATP-binding protein EcfA2